MTGENQRATSPVLLSPSGNCSTDLQPACRQAGTAYSVAKLGFGLGFIQPQASNLQLLDFPGGHTAGATPVPIPNTEVKPRRADDTARVTVWERRSLPGLNLSGPPRFYRGGPLCLDPPGNSLLF